MMNAAAQSEFGFILSDIRQAVIAQDIETLTAFTEVDGRLEHLHSHDPTEMVRNFRDWLESLKS